MHTVTWSPRKSIPGKVVSLLEEWKASDLYANISYEVDELRRDIQICELGTEKGIRCAFVQDRLIVDPGILKTKEGKTYSVCLAHVPVLSPTLLTIFSVIGIFTLAASVAG